MKKALSLVLALAMSLSLVACGSKTEAPAPEASAPEANKEPNIAPVSIDISPMLEKALEATLERIPTFNVRIRRS